MLKSSTFLTSNPFLFQMPDEAVVTSKDKQLRRTNYISCDKGIEI